MKTLEEFTKELDGSETLRKEFIAAKGSEALGDFLKKNGCGFTAEDFLASVRPEGELVTSE
ncbi:MAG: hypothetical protein IKP47_00985 [Ruminococcus sp.]|nr:hypothetical protein [Ruminococcus sp.]